ncbi:MAG: response regulator [Lachnospiraceae bacterium]|jgi:signal transduction histidine kinase/response regulator of citrate/malate metabolism|nr:response regulator [Lachnospiraceae bacterium]
MEEKKQERRSGFTSKLEKQAVSLLLAKDELEKKNIELENAMIDARKASRARDVFLANMSHEIRTPINTMLGLNELILRESQDETIRGYALDIKQAGTILLSLVSDILDFSKLQSGKMELAEGTYDISSLLNDLINSVSIPLRKKKLRLSLDIAPDIPYKLSGDEVHLRQIIGNLLSNAVKYTQTGTVTLRLSWEKQEKDMLLLKIMVEDTGIGVKEKDIARIFETFNRLDMKASRNEEGTGLGLAVTHQLVGMMGGKLEVKSEYGKGSVFSFAIPQKIINPSPLGDFQEQYDKSVKNSISYREKFIAPLAKILVVDDNAMNLAVAQDLLRKTKLQIDVASSGGECLEMLKRKEYHLICMDHMMPVMDGVQTLRAIRELEDNPSRNIPVIALTANAVVGAREFYLKAGFEDYLSKPIEPDKLEDMLIQYLPKELVYLTEDEEISVENDDHIGGLNEEKLTDMGINAANGLKYMGGSRALYEKVLRDFREILHEKEEQLKNMLGKEDVSGYAIIVHALKGNARNVGADELAEEAFELEKKSKDGKLEEVEVQSPILFGMMRTLGENLDRYLETEVSSCHMEKEEEPAEKQQITEDVWREKLLRLYQQLDDFDGESVMESLAEFKKYQLTEEHRKMLRLCEKAVNDFAYDVAMEIVSSVL